ncbi:hypothetical protein LNP74_04985 [Klebsiella pneumoniae subsp. pneumoniae]|nr:hypothetical protein [Klebsiella pneumoniae subsp. pneumoniae]
MHYGHLKPAEIPANQIGLSKVIMLTTSRRTRPEPATSAQRAHMLKLAIADKPPFTLDEREVRRDTLLDGRKRCRSGARSREPGTNRLALIIGRIRHRPSPTVQIMKPFSTSHHLIAWRRLGNPADHGAGSGSALAGSPFTHDAGALYNRLRVIHPG